MLDMVENSLNRLGGEAVENKRNSRKNGEKFIWYSKDKNTQIKTRLSLDGENLSSEHSHFKARSSAKDGPGREWLYDFILREYDAEHNFVGVPLIAEIEFSDSKSGGLIYDLNKLLQADADHKVFIFQQKDEASWNGILARLEHSISRYRHKVPCTFLISCWLTSQYVFRHTRITVTP